MSHLQAALDDLTSKLNTETRVSDWLTIDQDRINAFADATLDHQWIHTNPEMAGQFSPFGTTVAHGFLTLSLIPFLGGSVDPDAPSYEGVKLGVNYGMNKVRFPNPVAVGSKVRARVMPISAESPAENVIQIVSKITVEIEGAPKPGCVAESVSRLYF